jgi:hypothetical protein
MGVYRRTGSRRAVLAMLALAGALVAALLGDGAALAAVSPDVAVSDQRDFRADGRPADETITTCSTNDRQQNEPAAAVNPNNTNITTSSSNDYCTVETTDNTRAGFYRSTDGGNRCSATAGYLSTETTTMSPLSALSPSARGRTTTT